MHEDYEDLLEDAFLQGQIDGTAHDLAIWWLQANSVGRRTTPH